MPSREYTPDEVRELFLQTVWGQIKYWEMEARAETPEAKLEGLAHSMLALIDGSVGFMPAFILAPMPHKDNKEYAISEGRNYFPQNAPTVKADIGGRLANELFRVKERLDKARGT